jgi:hypothetical protein
VLPRTLQERVRAGRILPPCPRPAVAGAAGLAAAVVLPVSLAGGVTLIPGVELTRWIAVATDWVGQYRIANRYHVFPTIERQRIEVQIAASLDGKNWRPYEFRYLPEDPRRIAPFIVPHHPRLDWTMWFVPVSPFFLDWFERFLNRLLEGPAPVMGLLREPPFGDQPAAMLKVEVYRYRFTTPEERERTGDWWRREYLGPFYPLPFLARTGSG